MLKYIKRDSKEIQFILFYILTIIGMIIPFVKFRFVYSVIETGTVVENYTLNIFGYKDAFTFSLIAGLLSFVAIYLIVSKFEKLPTYGIILLWIATTVHLVIYIAAFLHWIDLVFDGARSDSYIFEYYFSSGILIYPIGILGTIFTLIKNIAKKKNITTSDWQIAIKKRHIRSDMIPLK